MAIPAANQDTLYNLLHAPTASMDFRVAMGSATADTLLTAYTDLVRVQDPFQPDERVRILRGAILSEMEE